ncbi:hypothetical protein DL93DRAFT_2103652 [Clavulina sp. PMI_390]|nr:hypothetical protein DL93DRAFT_2103652 [Clavulina sp. PMI_390]
MELDIQLPPPSKDATEASSPLTTEIYVPYIHYHAKTLAHAEMVDQSPGPAIGGMSEMLRDQLADSARLHFIDTGIPNVLAVDVEVSEGSYEIQGQMLRWLYKNPAGTNRSKMVLVTRAFVSPCSMLYGFSVVRTAGARWRWFIIGGFMIVHNCKDMGGDTTPFLTPPKRFYLLQACFSFALPIVKPPNSSHQQERWRKRLKKVNGITGSQHLEYHFPKCELFKMEPGMPYSNTIAKIVHKAPQ